MIILDATTQTLDIDCTAARAVECAVSYIDVTTTTCTPGVIRTSVNTSTRTTICAAPAASTQRIIKEVVITSIADASVVFILYFNNNSTLYDLTGSLTIQRGGQLTYNEHQGWRASSLSHLIESKKYIGFPQTYSPRAPIDRANATATIALTSTTSLATLVGPVISGTKGVLVTFRVTTNPATLTYVEIALAVSDTLTPGGNPTLIKKSWRAWDQSIGTGVKSFFLPINRGLAGDDIGSTSYKNLWVVIGTQATTAGTLRGSLADDLQSCVCATATVRPGAIDASSGTAFTIVSATAVIPLIQAQYIF